MIENPAERFADKHYADGTFVDPDTNEVYLKSSVLVVSYDTVLAALVDGVKVIRKVGTFFVPAAWVAKEQPLFAEIVAIAERIVRERQG